MLYIVWLMPKHTYIYDIKSYSHSNEIKWYNLLNNFFFSIHCPALGGRCLNDSILYLVILDNCSCSSNNGKLFGQWDCSSFEIDLSVKVCICDFTFLVKAGSDYREYMNLITFCVFSQMIKIADCWRHHLVL